ncbi:hypothetical protein HK104_004211, partial [Borealophlyctis nickersoniae]
MPTPPDEGVSRRDEHESPLPDSPEQSALQMALSSGAYDLESTGDDDDGSSTEEDDSNEGGEDIIEEEEGKSLHTGSRTGSRRTPSTSAYSFKLE